MPWPRTARQAELVDLARRLAEPVGARAARHDRDNTFPVESFRELRAGGYLALTVPEEYGGRGANPLEVALAQLELARGDGSTALGAGMHLAYVGRLAETRVWPEERFAAFCREVVERGALINSAHSEPELGSPSRGGLPRTTATRVSGGWRLSGRKRWTTLASALSHLDVLATVVDGEEPPRRANFLVRADSPGVSVDPVWDNLGMRATASDDIVVEDVFVPDDARLPGEAARSAPDARGWGPLLVSAVYLGVAQAARDVAVAYARERRPAGLPGPIAELPTVQHRVAELEVLLLQARTLLFATAEAWVERPAARAELALHLAAAKYTAANHAIQIIDLALRVVGAAGLARDLPLERYFRDVRSGLNQPPIDDVALTQIGRAALSL